MPAPTTQTVCFFSRSPTDDADDNEASLFEGGGGGGDDMID
jgi:hypothetical protein